ncbi:MAG: DUF3237 family protein [Pseudomonadota bacterium]|nr:DUF3237 family protein [Pseudomonadota bacterium]
MIAPKLTHYFDCYVDIAPALDLGKTSEGHRLVFNILGGRFEGPYASGEMLPGGADWQLIRNDGVTEIDVRATMRTNDGVTIGTQSIGIRHASQEVTKKILNGEAVPSDAYYFKTTPRYQVPEGYYPELIQKVFVGIGFRKPKEVGIKVFAVD